MIIKKTSILHVCGTFTHGHVEIIKRAVKCLIIQKIMDALFFLLENHL